MALQSYTIAVGNLQDDTSGNNYAVNKAVYILKQDKTIQPIFADLEGDTPITQDGVNNVTNNRGEFSFYVEPNDYIARVGGIDKAFSVVGSDYFNNKVDDAVNLIIDTVAGRGAYYPVGSFEAGFTYTDINQVGTFGTAPNITYYVYTGGLTNLPHTVTAGTDPTASDDYENVFYTDHNALTNRNAAGAHDDIYNRNFNSVSDLRSGIDSTGQTIDMSLMIGRTVKVLNYYDGIHGGGFKGKVKQSVHTDDGFTTFSVTTNIYVEQIISGDAVNIRKAGAKSGDETFDSSVAVNTILEAGYTPKIPDGSFYGAGTVLLDNRTIKGVSRESSKWISRVVNKPAFKIINSATGNTTNRSDMKDFCIIGQEDPLNNSEVLLEIGTDSNGFVATADIRGMRFFGGSSGNILFTGGVECNIIGNDIWRSKGPGIYINPKANFANTNRITQNRIKNNWIGIACSAYENIGVFSAPTNPTSLELGNIKIYNNLLEENTNSNNDDPWFDYANGLGTNTRPGIGVLLEGSHDVKIYDNWIESYYQGIRLNFRNKFTYINDNLLGFSRYQTDLQGTGRDEFGGLVLDSTGDTLGNSGNIIKENDFVMKNEYTGGNFEGDHLLLKGIYNQGNLFLDNFTDTIGSDRNITITSDTFSDKNFIEYVDKSDNDDMGRVIDGYIKANYVVAERIDRVSEGTNLVTDNLEGLDAGGNGLIKRMRSRNTAGTIDRGTFDIFATPYTSTDASNKTGVLYGTANPEGLGAISDYDEGTIYIRKGAGLYVKDSPRGTATGWFNINSLIP